MLADAVDQLVDVGELAVHVTAVELLLALPRFLLDELVGHQEAVLVRLAMRSTLGARLLSHLQLIESHQRHLVKLSLRGNQRAGAGLSQFGMALGSVLH